MKNCYYNLIYSTISSIINKGVNTMNNIITANDLKTKGVSAIEEITQNSEAIITVRGKSKYVILSIEEYNQLREYELESAIQESLEDIKAGNIYDESIDDHMKRISGA